MDINEKNKLASASKKIYSAERMVGDYYKKYDKMLSNKRIMLIDVNYKGSSTGQIVYSIYSSAKKYGKEVRVCYGRGPDTNDRNVYKFGLDWETYLHAGLARITGYNGCFSYWSTKRLIRQIEEFEPDIIHIHELHAYFVNIEQLISYIKRKKIPVLWTFHCEYMYTGKCGYAYTCNKYQTECKECPAKKAYPKSLFFDKTNQMFLKKKNMLEDLDFCIVTPSESLAERVKLSFLKSKDISTIWNGVDTTIFYPRNTIEIERELGNTAGTKIVLFVGNIDDKTKGIRWVENLANELIDENITFVIVGGGTYEGKPANNMRFVGKVESKNKMAEIYSLADAFLLCSEKETFSMTCAEALCCGTPIVGFECGAPEVVFKGEGAEFVPYGDVQKLKKALLKRLNILEKR